MSRIDNALHNSISALELTRDELKLHAHLLKADIKQQWDELETKWSDLEEHLGRAEVAVSDSKQEIDAAVGLLLDSLKNGYRDLRNALKM